MAKAKANNVVVRRSLQLVGGGHNKFWCITMCEDGYTETHYGRIGTSGQTTLKRFNSYNEAVDYVDKMVNEKFAKGYRKAVDDGDLTVAIAPQYVKPENHAEVATTGLIELLKELA